MTEEEANNYLEILATNNKDNFVKNKFSYVAKISHPSKSNEKALLVGVKNLSYSNIFKANSFILKGLKTEGKIIDEDLFYEQSDEIEFLSCLGTNDGIIKRQKYLEGGISISSNRALNLAGTLGGLFKIEKSDDIYFITNAHVLKFGSIENGKNIVVHPAIKDDIESNILEIGEIIWMSNYQDNLDAAVVKVFPLSKNFMLRNSTRCSDINFKKIKKPIEGLKVKKCGRTTGLKKGKIISENCLVITKEGIQFKNQIMTSLIADSGDSGSILSDINDNVIGLMYAKNKNCSRNFSNPITPIFQLAEKQISNFKFKNFITKNNIKMGKTIIVDRGKSNLVHQLIKYENNEVIEVKFTSWDNKAKSCPTEIEIVKNAKNHKILAIDCTNNNGCNELQIKFEHGTTSNNFKTKIKDCNLLNTQVVTLQFKSGEDYKKIKCSDKYSSSTSSSNTEPIPDTKKGNILQGNP